MGKKLQIVLLACAAVVVFAASAFATGSGFDYSSVADAVSTEITTGLPLFAGMVGLVIGIPLTVHLAKRLAR